MASLFFFFFNDTATTAIYTLSLHDALPIFQRAPTSAASSRSRSSDRRPLGPLVSLEDRKSIRLNSSHSQISYAVFCLKKKNIRLVLAVSITIKKPMSLSILMHDNL